MTGQAWFFGLLREAGGYRIVAAGPTEGRVRRAMEGQTNPTLIVTQDDLPSVGIGEREWRRWLPEAPEPQEAQEPQRVQGAPQANNPQRVQGS